MERLGQYAKRETRYWWTSLIVGILAIILGIWSLSTPDVTLAAITYIFAVGLLIIGIIDVIYAVANKNILYGWGWVLTEGLIDIIFGIFMLSLPIALASILMVYLVGFWILFSSIWAIGIASELNRFMNAGWLLAVAILGLVFSLIYLLSPGINGVIMIFMVSMALMIYGIFRIWYAFVVRSINARLRKLENS